MIPTKNDTMEITQDYIINSKYFRAIISPHPGQRITHHPSYLHASNIKDDPFIVDWQLTIEENFEEERQWY